jgi:hypothetical protein
VTIAKGGCFVEFDLKQIKAGGMEDPKLQPGDRIEVLR